MPNQQAPRVAQLSEDGKTIRINAEILLAMEVAERSRAISWIIEHELAHALSKQRR